MANAFKCDNCGELFEGLGMESWLGGNELFSVLIGIKYCPSSGPPSRDAELCKKCFRSVVHLLGQPTGGD